MPCYHPLKGWITGRTKNEKNKLTVTSYKIDHLEHMPDGRIERIYGSDHVYKMFGSDIQSEFIELPCGKCIGCRLEQSRQWANRCLLEMKYHDENYFVTLTYDDDHLPSGTGVHPETGEIITTHSLVKRDFQLFMKRLREKYGRIYPEAEKIRFFCAGEYGDHTARPHYHVILFGLHLDDLRFYKKSGEYNLFTSDFLSSCWCTDSTESDRQPKGFVVVAPANWETAAYTARYCCSKLTGPLSDVYRFLNICPPFTLMSRKPGIGLQYLEDNFDAVEENEYIYLQTDRGGRQCRPPKYYKRKIEEIFEKQVEVLGSSDQMILLVNDHEFAKLKVRDEMVEAARLLCQQTDNSYLDMLASQEAVLNSKVKALERSL